MAIIHIKSVADSPKPKNGGGDYDMQRPIACGPDKWYRAVVTKCDVVPGKTSGKPQIKAAIGIDGNEGGVLIFHYVVEPQNNSPQRLRFFRALGMLETHEKGLAFDTDLIEGLELMVKPRFKKGTGDYADSHEAGDMKPIKGDNEISRRYLKEPVADETEPGSDAPFSVDG